jgi:hypothetical protein
VSPRGVWAAGNSKLLQLARSPIVVVVLAAFALMVASLPGTPGPGAAERVRQATSWMLAAAAALLGVTALVVPVSGGAPATRFRESRLLGGRASNLGHGLAGLAFLVFLAGVLALVVWLVILLRFGNPDAQFQGAVVRRVLWRNEAAISLPPGRSWTSVIPAPGAHAGSLLVEIRPHVRFLGRAGQPSESAPASAPARGAGPPELELSWSADGGKPRTRRVHAQTGRPIVETIEVPLAARTIALGVASAGADVDLGIEPGAMAVLGSRVGCFAVAARALLVVACAASVLGVLAQWFSNFVSPAIAFAAAVTLAFAAVVASAIWGFDLLRLDPVAAFRRGHETAWADVGRAAAASAAAAVLGAAAAVGRRGEAAR